MSKPKSSNTTYQRTSKHSQEEVNKKKNNIVIYGLQEISAQNDVLEVCHINRAIGNYDFSKYNILRIGRLGEGNGVRPRPLKIELDHLTTKIDVLRNANKLQHTEQYNKISIQHDLTKSQVAQLKQLKETAKEQERKDDEGKYRYRVRGRPGNWMITKLPKN